MSTHYDLQCRINPQMGSLRVKGEIHIPTSEKKFLFVLNRGLKWKSTSQRIGDERYRVGLYQTDEMDVPRFYNGDLWAFEVKSEIEQDDEDKIVIEFEYSGQIHPQKKDSGMPTMGYIKRDFVELACYSAWYPVPLSMDTYLSFKATLSSPSDWTWDANGESSGSETTGSDSVWTWTQPRQVNDITLIGLPVRDAHTDSESYFRGPKRMVSSQKKFDEHIHKLRGMLEDWLGPPDTDAPLRFMITPREKGGAYARSGMVVVGGGYSTDSSLHNAVLQAMCHEICHDWFNKTSPLAYDNWVDEALAEYCSIHVVDDYVDDGFLNSMISRAKDRLDNAGELPAIKNLVREKEESHAAFYYRGFLLLNEVSENVGIPEFREVIGEFARECTQKKTITSDMFLELIQKKLGKNAREMMGKWLEYSGKGSPS